MRKGVFHGLALMAFLSASAADEPWFMNVVPVWEGTNLAFTVSEMLRQKETAGLEVFIPSLSFHPQTSPARDLIPRHCARFHELKQAVDGKGVRLGVLVQSLLGHGWNGKVPLTDESWQHVVKIDGSESPRFCSMDPGFRAYVHEAITALVKEGPEFLLVDDDCGIRLGECFCPLHLKAIGAALGRSCTREEIEKMYGDRPLDDPELVAINRVLGETICDFARSSIRAAIDSVDPQMRCGICACWPGYWQMDGLVHALAGKTKPFMRVNNSCYADQHAQGLVHSFQGTRAVMYQVGSDVEVIDEADTFPQNYMSESATMLHAHLASGLLSGLVGAKLWVAEFQEPRFTDSQCRYEARLRDYRGFYAKLRAMAREGIDWKGVCGPVVRPSAGFGGHPSRTPEGIYPRRWSTPIEAVYALPLRYDGIEKGGIIALREENVDRMDDGQVRAVLAGKAVVDSLAARKLTDRGFAPLMGVSATAGGKDFNFQSEWSADGMHSIGHMWGEAASELCPVDGKAVASWNFCKGPRFHAPRPVSPSAVRYANSLGGKVVTLGWSFGAECHNVFRPVRKLQLLGELDWLNGAPLEMVGLSGDQALVRYGVTAAGEEVVAFFSLSYEVLPELRLRVLHDPKEVCALTPQGEWKPVTAARRDAETLAIGVAVNPLEPIVLKINR